MSEVIAKVLAAAREVPAHAEPSAGCVVHQPANVYPIFARVPVFPTTVTEEPLAYELESIGTEPDAGLLPL